ncbi:putative polysaccharide biosynthesis protein [Ligilactobacillus salitolerans]|nr:polysaccharide biosynthesis protein [Ligilactobacillus salitolerans]
MKKTMKGALILTLAAVTAKVLSALYRIPFQNIVGNTGFYVYQQIYPLYGIGMTLALNGLPAFISKLVAQEDDEEKQAQVAARLFVLLAVLAVLLFGLLQLGAGLLSRLMGDPKLASLITSVSWMFLLMPFLASARGYGQGIFDMIPTALSQVSEQMVRVGLIIGAALAAQHLSWSVYQTGSVAMLASVLGGASAVLVLLPTLRKFLRYVPAKKAKISYSLLLKALFKEGAVLCLFAALMVLLQLVDSFTVLKSLQDFGMSSQKAKFIKGIYDRGQPLVQVGMTVALSFSATLLPSLTATLKADKKEEFHEIAQTMLHSGIALATAASAGLISLMPQVNLLLFGDSQLSLTLCIYIVSIPLISTLSILNSILQSKGSFGGTWLAVILTLAVKIFLNSWLISHIGIMGAALSTALGLVAGIAALTLIWPRNYREQGKRQRNFGIKLLLCVAAMMSVVFGAAWICQQLFQLGRLQVLIFVPCAVILGVLVFVLTATQTHLFTLAEWEALPGGSKLVAKINHIKKHQ